MNKRTFLAASLGLLAALAGSTTQTANTTNVAARARQMTGQLLPGEAKQAEAPVARPTKQSPDKPTNLPAGDYQVAIRPRAFAGGDSLRYFPVQQERRRVKRGRSSWVVLG